MTQRVTIVLLSSSHLEPQLGINCALESEVISKIYMFRSMNPCIYRKGKR
jgi:hypothetical protein